MPFKMINPKAASTSHSTAMAKLANAGVSYFGRIDTIHCVNQRFPSISNIRHHM